MKGFDDLYRRILPRVRGVAVPMVDEAIRQAAIELCQRTRVWRDSLQITTTDALDFEALAAPEGAEVFEIESARFNGQPVEAVSRDWLDDHVPSWRTLQGDLAKWITQANPDTVRLVPAAAGTLDLDLYLKPSNAADELPDFLIDHHARALSDGALAELYATPGDFQNPGLAQFHAARFAESLDALFDTHATGQQAAPVRVKAQFQ